MKKQEQFNTPCNFFFLSSIVKLVQRDRNKTLGTQKLDLSHDLHQLAVRQVMAQTELEGSTGMFSRKMLSYRKHES